MERLVTNGKIKRKAPLTSIIVLAAAIVAFAVVTVGITAAPVYAPGPSACPDPGQCTCNAASGVMTDHAMQPPFNRINNGCTEQGPF